MIKGVTVSGAGDKNTVSAGLPLSLSAKVDKVGILSDDVTWSIPNAPAGVTFTPAQGKTTTLSVAETVSVGTQIKVRATSKADSSKFGEFSVTVQGDSEEFDINRCNVEYWEDFDGAATQEELTNRVTEAGILSEVNQLDTSLWHNLYEPYYYGLKTKEGAMNGCFTGKESYYQVALKNEEDKEKIYALSFMISIIRLGMDTGDIGYAYQSSQIADIPDTPVKLISVNADGEETVLQENINIPLCCSVWLDWKDYYNISTEVKVPAGETLFIRLKYDGELPSCCVPDDDSKNKDDPHPLVYEIENVAISSSKTSTITMNVGEEYQLNLDTVDGDEVTYYTNSQWAQENHNPNNETNTTLFRECHNFDTTVANVDETGKITANSAGETALIVEIKRGDEVIRKQCIVKVK